MSLFFVDSSCDLSPQQIKSLGIECFCLPYKIDGQIKYVCDDFDYNKFYSKIRKGISLEFVSCEVDKYIEVFEPALQGGDDIIYVHSSTMIFDITNLLKAKNELCARYPERRFELIDSKNISVGHGAVCFALALKYKNGANIDEIIESSYQIIDGQACYLIIDSLESISNYGLIDTSAVVGTALNIKSILAVDIDGNIKLIEKVSGRKRAISKVIQIIRQTGQNIADNPIFVSDSMIKSDAEFLTSTLREYYGNELRILGDSVTPSNVAVLGKGVMSVSFRVYKKVH